MSSYSFIRNLFKNKTTKNRENKRKEIMSLRVGDIVIIGKSPRLIRRIRVVKNRNGKEMKHFYFAKKKRSQYPDAYTSYNVNDMDRVFNGLVKRGVKLINTKEEAAVQYSINADLCGNTKGGGKRVEHIKSAKKYGLYASQEQAVRFK